MTCLLYTSGSYGSTFNSKCREGTEAKDQQWIENDIGNTADHKSCHSDLHLADTLEDFFIGKVDGVYGCKQKYNCRIMDPKADDICIRSEQGEESGHDKDAADSQDHTVQSCQDKTVSGSFTSGFSVSGTKTDSDQGTDTDSKADGNGVCKVLYLSLIHI